MGRSLCEWEIGENMEITPLVGVYALEGSNSWRRGHNDDRGHMHGWRGHKNDRGRMHRGRDHIEKNDRGHMLVGHPWNSRKGGVSSTVCQSATVMNVRLGQLPPKCDEDPIQVWLRDPPQLITGNLIKVLPWWRRKYGLEFFLDEKTGEMERVVHRWS